jgi:hypothetical protein
VTAIVSAILVVVIVTVADNVESTAFETVDSSVKAVVESE